MNQQGWGVGTRLIHEEAGVTALETAIILLAFVTVAATFAYTVLSVGTVSTAQSKKAVLADLAQVQSSMELKGGVLALASTAGITSTVDAIVFTVASAVGGQSINLAPAQGGLVIDYRDERQQAPLPTWTLRWKVRTDADDLLDANELAEITVPLSTTLTTPLGINTAFALELKPQSGSTLIIRRTTPPHIERVYDLQ